MNLCLKGFAEQRGSWLDVYPGESLFETADADQILVVDVGGGLVCPPFLHRQTLCSRSC